MNYDNRDVEVSMDEMLDRADIQLKALNVLVGQLQEQRKELTAQRDRLREGIRMHDGDDAETYGGHPSTDEDLESVFNLEPGDMTSE